MSARARAVARIVGAPRRGAVGAGLAVLVLLSGALAGCASVPAYDREYLSDRIMDYDRDSREERVSRKWLEAREGSTGGVDGAGGGCACN